jgi:hypothetical protein
VPFKRLYATIPHAKNKFNLHLSGFKNLTGVFFEVIQLAPIEAAYFLAADLPKR